MPYECMAFFIVVIGFERYSGDPEKFFNFWGEGTTWAKSVVYFLRCGKVKRKVLYIEMCF